MMLHHGAGACGHGRPPRSLKLPHPPTPPLPALQTETLGFTPAFLGQVQLAAALASFAGVMVYNSWLKQVPVRRLMLVGTLLAATLQSGQLVLVSGLHRQFGIDDHVFVSGVVMGVPCVGSADCSAGGKKYPRVGVGMRRGFSPAALRR